MSKFVQEFQRLYFLPDQPWPGALAPDIPEQSRMEESGLAFDLVSPAGRVRALVIDFARAADWASVAGLYQGLQEDLEWPAPAISVSGQAGYRLWLSLAESIPLAEAQLFLERLRQKYLAELAVSRLALLPVAGESASALTLVPARHLETGKWSAFIDPTMGAMFVDEPGLEMAPNMERQADLLARLKSVGATDFQRGLEFLRPPADDRKSPVGAPVGAVSMPPENGRQSSEKLNLGNQYADPQSFLLAVMNDPAASTDQRIAAAKALLPYFTSNKGQ